METRPLLEKFIFSIKSAMVVLLASLFIISIVYAATTIGSNIITGGALNVTGISTFTSVTSTSATTTGYLMVGNPFDLPDSFDYNEDLAVSGDLVVGGNSSTTATTTAGLFRLPNGYCVFEDDTTTTPNMVMGKCPDES